MNSRSGSKRPQGLELEAFMTENLNLTDNNVNNAFESEPLSHLKDRSNQIKSFIFLPQTSANIETPI